MKKFVSILLLFIFSITTFAYAAENASGNEAQKLLLSVKERIGDTSVYDKFESSTSGENTESYSFYWSTSDSDNYSSLSVTCNSLGIITNYYHYEDYSYKDAKATINRLSQSEAMEKAYALISGLNPSINDKIKLVNNNRENLYSNDYTFEIKHVENGIEVYGDGGYVTVDINAEKIKSYRITYTSDIEYKSIENVISREAAKKAYSEKLGLELRYNSYYDGTKIKILPVYTEKSTNIHKYIDALNGDIYEYNYKNAKQYTMASDSASGGSNSKNFAAAREESLTDAEVEELEKVENLISKEDLTKILKENEYLPLPQNYVLSSFRTSKSYNDETKRISRLRFINEENGGNISYTLNSKTGLIESYYAYEDYDVKSNIKLDSDAALKLLKATAAGLSGSIFEDFNNEVYSYPEKNEKGSYNSSSTILSYTRNVNGIPYYNDYISIAANIYTGKIESYNLQYTQNAEFPGIENAIEYENAIDVLFNEADYELCYMVNEKTATPVYMFNNDKDIIINALNGVFVSYALEEYEPEYSGYEDIENHYAKDAIEKLAEYGIYFEGKHFSPDTPISQKDFVYMLNCCFGYNSPEPRPIDSSEKDAIYRDFAINGIVYENEKNPDGTVTRYDAAKFIIRAMGYESVAKLEIYKPAFTDVTADTGYVSILSAMKILNGNGDGTFNPKDCLSRADAAMMIYNYLSM